ncbi:MAG: hypothetical protein Q8L68_00305 [Methylococcales bacterium]|nr:hypothetical protein [Methylococcales bacterium]
MKHINVEITGIAPLLQNRFPMEEHGHNISKAIKKVYVPEDEAKKCLYIKNDIIFQPAEHIYQSMIRASTDFKFSGKKTFKDVITSGVVVEPEEIPLISDKYEIDTRAVVIQRSRVLKWRPRFNQWKLQFKLIILDDQNISISALKEILEKAGATKGIGDYRPRFGRFQVTSFQEAQCF